MAVNKNFIPTSVEKNMNPLSMPDCIHLTDQCKCNILRVKKCPGSSCTFCQTANEKHISDTKWTDELNNIDSASQQKISREYYGGKMPWKKQ